MGVSTNSGTTASPWTVSPGLEERERALTATGYATAAGLAAEREERWHAAHLFRGRYAQPESWLDCCGLADVPEDPAGWCTCPSKERDRIRRKRATA
jgi:hypothetical protein